MLFTSITFAIFLLLVFLLYWFIFNKNLKGQNLFLLISGYVFYGWWDWRFIFLLLFISASNYLIGREMQRRESKRQRKLPFIIGLIINLGTLVLFKYFNFFIEGFTHLVSLFGFKANPLTISLILPLGISFYIFLSISYIIDVYHRKLDAVSNIFEALLTFSFFPIILAGPIHRPIGLLPQIQARRTFSYSLATDGLRQILWGVFMKIVVADKCADSVNIIFNNPSIYSASTLVLGIFFFTVQIYADFAGYSNIAIGIGKLLGFNIMKNFQYPYFARDIREFWQRWNISLTQWFRDYVFLPVAYSVSRKIKTDRFILMNSELFIYIVGITVTWILTGLWHGANYTFIVWGLFHGFFLTINHVMAKPRKKLLKHLKIRNDNTFLILADTIATFIIIMCSWIFFRSADVGHAFSYITHIFSVSLFTLPEIRPTDTIMIVAIFAVIEWFGRKQEHGIAGFGLKWYRPIRWAFYYMIIFAIIYFAGKEQQFIYFRF